MKSWDEQWFGPVAAIRPYLFQKCLMLMLAFDLLVLMVERGGRYGLDPIPFNVPHFKWLNALHALVLPFAVPTATFYVCLIVVTSFFAFTLLLAGHRPWLMAITTVLYTYCWSMSRLDSYLHHYMITLIMACMIFFPAIDARLLRDDLFNSRPSPGPRGWTPAKSFVALAWLLLALAVVYRIMLSQAAGLVVWQRWAAMGVACLILSLLVVRWCVLRAVPSGPSTNSWAYRLLGTTVGVIYVFTSIAKMDAEWCAGYTLRKVGSAADILAPIEQMARSIGIPSELFWSVLATLVIPLELTLAASYLIAIRQDEPNRKWLRRWSGIAWLLAVGLHLNNEMMNLVIQWFGYYMLLLATLILLPARLLNTMGCVFYLPESSFRDRYVRWMEGLSTSQATVVLGLISFFALFVLVLTGFFMGIAGALFAACIIAAGLVVALVIAMVLGWERRSISVSLTAAAAGVLMIAAVAQSSMRFDYYDLRGKTLQQMGFDERAIGEMEQALIFPASDAAAAEVHTNLGLSYRRTNRFDEAEKNYRLAIQLDSGAFLAHYGFANMLVGAERYDEAEAHYHQAVAIKPDFSDALVNLGSLLEFQKRIPEALACYRRALAIEPDAEDIRQLMQNAASLDK